MIGQMGKTIDRVTELLGAQAAPLLEHRSTTISKDRLHLPGPDFVDRIWLASDRSNQVLRNLQTLFGTGRLAKTGYLSILPVDQGIEHSAGASFAPNPDYFDPENIVKLAIEGGCNAVASTFGVLGIGGAEVRAQDSVPGEDQSQRVADLSEQVRSDHVRHGEAGVRHGRGRRLARRSISARRESDRQIVEVAQAFAQAHELGMATVLWCYLRNPRLQDERTRIITSRPTSPARPITWA